MVAREDVLEQLSENNLDEHPYLAPYSLSLRNSVAAPMPGSAAALAPAAFERRAAQAA